MFIDDWLFWTLIGLPLITLLPTLLTLKTFKFSDIKIFFKAAMKPAKYCVVWVEPYGQFVLGQWYEGGIVYEINKVRYYTLPTQVRQIFNRIPMIVTYIDEGYIMPVKTKRELEKLVKAADEQTVQDYLRTLMKIRELETKNELSQEERELLAKCWAYVKYIEDKYNVCVDVADIPTKNDIYNNSTFVITKIDYSTIRNYFMNVNPASAYHYAENLAQALYKSMQTNWTQYVIPMTILIIGAAIAYVIIQSYTGGQVDVNQLVQALKATSAPTSTTTTVS